MVQEKKSLGWVLKSFVRLIVPFFTRSDFRVKAWLLLLCDLGLMIVSTWTSVLYTTWNGKWVLAYTSFNYELWVQQLILFLIICLSLTLTIVGKVYIETWLRIRMREWMTHKYVGEWLDNSNHYRMQLTGNVTDNPDQRISQDIESFLTYSMTYTLQLLQNLMNLGTMIVVLWGLSAAIPLYFGGVDVSFPGYFIVVALIWSAIATTIAHVTGSKLVRLNFMQQRFEADFRFSLVRVRENSEQIALLKGEPVEQTILMNTFNNVLFNTFRNLARTFWLSITQSAFMFLDGLVISLLLGPAHFAGLLPNGYADIQQVAMAFSNVITAFKFFQTNYAFLALWVTSIERLAGLLEDAERMEVVQAASKVRVHEHNENNIFFKDIQVNYPNGTEMITAKGVTIKSGEKVLIKGRTGAGKTTMFRVLAGLWPYGDGEVYIPKGKKVIILPQHPYIPVGTLAEAISYPEPKDTYTRTVMEQVLRDVGLDKFVSRLDEFAHWNHVMSGGEQQRIGIARAMLFNPEYLFFDEATASMDEPSEAELYGMLLERMKSTTIISIGHRSSLEKFHETILFAQKDPKTGVTELTSSAPKTVD